MRSSACFRRCSFNAATVALSSVIRRTPAHDFRIALHHFVASLDDRPLDRDDTRLKVNAAPSQADDLTSATPGDDEEHPHRKKSLLPDVGEEPLHLVDRPDDVSTRFDGFGGFAFNAGFCTSKSFLTANVSAGADDRMHTPARSRRNTGMVSVQLLPPGPPAEPPKRSVRMSRDAEGNATAYEIRNGDALPALPPAAPPSERDALRQALDAFGRAPLRRFDGD